ncbi:unnamed protein product [Owenia fusiformis]|uniref:Sulfotransferase family protein n=1 Tax=Owenia fusiformis TaxID=6347 RepID=A0A8S4N0Q4_OWEFU|nr:unnamed protein product [Owenia fusiformis]
MDNMGNNTQVRVLLWCVPRSCSTAFMRVMENCKPGKVKVLDELYYKSYYLSEERRSERYYNTKNHKGTVCGFKKDQLSYASRLSLYNESYTDYDIVFGKEMSLFLEDKLDNDAYVPRGYQHTFLIRHPEKTIPSLYKCFLRSDSTSIEDITAVAPEGKYMYQTAHDLFHQLKAKGDTPIVIDTEDLLRNPIGAFQAYCNATKLPFRREMLNWEEGKVKNKWFEYPEWYGALIHSKCFGQIQTENKESLYTSNNNSNVKLQEEMDRIHDMIKLQIANNLPLYEDLYKYRIRMS